MMLLLFVLQCYMCLSEFEESKSCLKRCLKISESVSSERQEVSQQVEKQLKAGKVWFGVLNLDVMGTQ